MKDNWQTKKLGEVCKIIGGGTPSKSNLKFYSGLIPWATVRDMKEEVIKQTEFNISEEAVKKSSTNIIPKNSVIIATRVGLGKVSILAKDTAINQDLRGVIPYTANQLDNRFLFQWFKSISRQIENEGTGATVKGVKLPYIKNLDIPVPPLSEQHRLVKILDEAFSAIAKAKENAEKNLQNSHELFESYLRELFTNTNNNWQVKKLLEVCDLISRGISPHYTQDKGVTILNQKCIRNHKISFLPARMHDINAKKIRIDKYLQVGDALVNSTGVGTLGRVAQVRGEIENTTVDSHITIIRPRKGIFHEDFLGYILILLEEEITKLGEGTSGQIELPRKMLQEIKVSYPESIEEQRRIVKTLDTLSESTRKLEEIYNQKLALLEELKKSLLHQAFTGQL